MNQAIQTADWPPHMTVAAIIEKNGRFLMVEEGNRSHPVLNQPAGHLEPNETLQQAVIRETLEETRWHIKPTFFLSLSTYQAKNGEWYYRHAFIAEALYEDKHAVLDEDIHQVLWLTKGQLIEQQARFRSPLVLKNFQQYQRGQRFSLSLIDDHIHG